MVGYFQEHGSIGLVIASIYQKGEVSNIVYCSPNEPLYLVPKSFFVVSRSSQKLMGLSKSRINKMTQIFRTGENVEFDADENGIVKWALKIPSVLDIEHTEGKFVIETPGILSPHELRFWTKNFGYLQASDVEIRQWSSAAQPDVTVKLKVRIEVDFGEHEPSVLRLESFKPLPRYCLDSILPGECCADLKLLAPWNCSPQKEELSKLVREMSLRDDDTKQESLSLVHKTLKLAASSDLSIGQEESPQEGEKISVEGNGSCKGAVSLAQNGELDIQQHSEKLFDAVAGCIEKDIKSIVMLKKSKLFKQTMNHLSSRRMFSNTTDRRSEQFSSSSLKHLI